MGVFYRNYPALDRGMMRCLIQGEEFLSKQTIREVEDLNLSDLAVFFETSLSFFSCQGAVSIITLEIW